MKLHKGSAGICLMVFGLLLCAKTHRQVSAGEAVLHFWGGPVQSSAGLHYVSLAGLLLMITGFALTSLYYREVAWIRLKLFLLIIGFTAVYPLLTEQLMFLLKWNASGRDTVEYIQQASSCEYDGDEEGGNMDCTVKLNNDGKETELVMLTPRIVDGFAFKAETVDFAKDIQHRVY
ncbi:hypothetical protein ACINLE_20505 [Bacillus sp. z60-18]|uniref:hypothetical protein n=2 Tax=Bacillaceae TaxID=186817 RepID=UPI000989B24E|nr:hypothetical protein [Bacillus sonorensis]